MRKDLCSYDITHSSEVPSLMKVICNVVLVAIYLENLFSLQVSQVLVVMMAKACSTFLDNLKL